MRRHQLRLIVVSLLIFLGIIFLLNRSSNDTKPSNLMLSKKKSLSYAEVQARLAKERESKKTDDSKITSTISEDQEKIKLINQNPENDKTGSRIKKAQDFYTLVFNIFEEGKPKIPALNRYKDDQRIYHAGYEGLAEGPVFTEEYLKSFLQLTEEEVESLKHSHKAVVNKLPANCPEGLYQGNGIVYVGGGKYNWLALLSIKTLRSVGSELPVEVLIPSIEEFEVDLCGRVFPALNARCILLAKELGNKVATDNSFYGYQYKSLAIITSSFEKVLLLDSDNVPIHAPDYLFDVEPFASNGLIVWPDFWKRATSPYYYQIAGRELGSRVRFGRNNYGTNEPNNVNDIDFSEDIPVEKVPLHDREGAIPDPTSESGQLMVSKKTHSKALFLALYYNLFGPDYYYPLFSQGSDGEGDKETFLAASVILNKKFYQVNKFLNAFGHFDSDGNFIGTGMGQYDPVEDYRILQRKLKAKDNEDLLKLQDSGEGSDFEVKTQPKILFVHANFPKLNPWDLKTTKEIFDKDGSRKRLYGTGMAKRIGYDFELVQWQNMHFLICELKLKLNTFKDIDPEDLCIEISEQLQHLEDSIATLETDFNF
ncbi:hypothetical protein PACTADRAFT_49688 [Pachysolen tannophilus NRRL Y-2460]|uniref:Glycosyltransferase family 71 protein n=1 Tax=Pachysolen tannophilus NRRL Y-2460 TaxID=669874 RepID=A0A1E4TX40_PACTA|nr:hypothetical protein PACTADRAFT_49688 [Pachysolen tannophilus NRRL Y-2460]